jgi:hypothetical protein
MFFMEDKIMRYVNHLVLSQTVIKLQQTANSLKELDLSGFSVQHANLEAAISDIETVLRDSENSESFIKERSFYHSEIDKLQHSHSVTNS